MIRAILTVAFALGIAAQLHAQLDFGPISKSDVNLPDELPEKLQPATPRTEAEEDKLTAAAHFAQGRLLQKKGETALALRHYQRAWRYDPEAHFLLADIVPLAFEARQNDAAARYAVLAAERDPKDALLVRRLAIYLTEKRDYPRAVKMYEQALAKDAQLVNAMPEDVGAATVYAELGRLYFLTEKYDAAAGTFAIVRKGIEHPDSPLDDAAKKSVLSNAATTYGLWGEAFLEAGKLDDALACFRKSHEEKADEPLLAYREARVYFAQNKFDEALQNLDNYFAAKNSTLGGGPYALLAKIVLKQAATPAAGQEQLIAKLQELHQAQPENSPLAFALVDALWAAGKQSDAIPLLSKTLERSPDPDRYAKLIEHHWQEKEYRELLAAAGQLADGRGSLDTIEPLLKRLIKDEALLTGCVTIAREQAAVKEPKPKPAPILAAALLAREAGKIEAAGELFQIVLDLSPPNPLELRTQWAIGLLVADQPQAASKMLREVLQHEPPPRNPSAIRYYLAGALAMAKQTDEALKEIRSAAEANPNNPRYESRIAWILYSAKRFPEAAAEYEQLLKKHAARQQPEYRDTLRSARLALSNIALEQGDFPQAVEWLEQVLDEYPEDPGALNDLGYLWADRGLHLERALRMTQRAVELEPANKAYRDSLGWAYYRLGRYDEAVRELTAATTGSDDEPDGVLLDHLGDALAKQGKDNQAQAAWKRAVEAYQKAGETKKMEAVQQKLSSGT